MNIPISFCYRVETKLKKKKPKLSYCNCKMANKSEKIDQNTTEFGYHIGDDLPCSVCRSSVQSSVMMIPGKSSCYGGWSMQYKGDLVAGNYANAAASQYICLDEHPETLTGGQRDENGKLFYPVKAVCGSLPCPPYQNGRYLSCVVCTK